MKKLLLSLVIAVGLFLPTLSVVGAGSAGAVDILNKSCAEAKAEGQTTEVCKDDAAQKADDKNPIVSVISSVLTVASYIAGIVAVIMVLIAGFRFVTANGDSNGVKSARESLIYALVGIAIVVTSQVIVAFVLNNI